MRTSEGDKYMKQADEERDDDGGKQEPERIFILQRCIVLIGTSVFVDLLRDETEVDTGCEDVQSMILKAVKSAGNVLRQNIKINADK
jgi:hypothetical protein